MTSRFYIPFFICLFPFVFAGCGGNKAWKKMDAAYPPGASPKPVLALIASPSQDKELAQISAWGADQTVTLLVDRDNFQVEDRTHTEALMKEKRLSLEGVLEGEKAVELGRLLSAPRALVVTGLVCRVDEIRARPVPRRKPTPVPSPGKDAGEVAENLALALMQGLGEGLGRGLAEAEQSATISLSLQLVDLESGLVRSSQTLRVQAQGRGSSGALSQALRLMESKLNHRLPGLFLDEKQPAVHAAVVTR